MNSRISHEFHIDTIERDKNNHQLIIEIFERLLKFGTESVSSLIFLLI